MFAPNPRVVSGLDDWLGSRTDVADGLREQLAQVRHDRRGDLTPVLLRAAAVAIDVGDDLPPVVQAAAVRAGCAALGARFPGHTVEVRVPPYAAVQLGFGAGPRHTRGTPPNVVELTPAAFLRLATGRATFESERATATVSGAQAAQVAAAFPLASV